MLDRSLREHFWIEALVVGLVIATVYTIIVEPGVSPARPAKHGRRV